MGKCQCTCPTCRTTHTERGGGSGLLWAIAGIAGGLYWLGARQRPAERRPSVEAVDETAVVQAWQWVTRLPQFRAMWQCIARRALQGRQDVRVLDIGSGAGQLATLLALQPEVRDVVGIDLSAEMIDQARGYAEMRGANAEFLQVDAAEMPFPEDAFDVAVSTVSLHHWSNPEQVLRELHRVLKPGGRALVFDLRRDASPFLWGLATLAARFVVPRAIRESGEPLASMKSAYTPSEAVLLAHKAGWAYPRVFQGPAWLVLELSKPEAI